MMQEANVQDTERNNQRAATFRARIESYYDAMKEDGKERLVFQLLVVERCELMMEGRL